MWAVHDVTDESFATEVLERDEPVVVSFWAAWCTPCKEMEPVLPEIAHEYAGRLRVCRVNTDENPEAVQRCEVACLPTFLLFQGGAVVGRFSCLSPVAMRGHLRGVLGAEVSS